MSAPTNQEICCGFCDAPIRPWAAGDPNSDLGCVACDNWASAEEVIALLEKYSPAQPLRDTRADSFPPFKVQTVAHRRYDIIAGGKL